MGSTVESRTEFVKRLVQACDESTVVPPPHQGRQSYIATRLGVAREAVSKWFKGVSTPRPPVMAKLAELLEVDVAWLHYGIKPEMDRAERRSHARQASGAAYLVRGIASLSGASLADPGKSDPRSTYVDFYATLNGRMFAVHVAYGREVEPGRFEVSVPKEYADANVIGVLPHRAEFHLIDMTAESIAKHKVRKSGEFAVSIERAEGGKYMTDDTQWTRIKSFADLR